MNFELEYLWNLCTQQSARQQNNKQKQSLIKELMAESERLKKVYLFFSPCQEVSLASFIRFQQHSLARLLSAVETGFEFPKSLQADHQQLMAELQLPGMLDELLDFINYNFPLEFDFNATISATCLLKEQKSQQAAAELIDKKLREKQINVQLRNIILDAVNLSDRADFTYGDLRYIHTISDQILSKLDNLDSEQAILNLLSAQNFNKPQFFEYLKVGMQADLESVPEISEKYKALLILKKETGQSVSRQTSQYTLLHPQLSESILGYLESERLFLKEMELITTEWVNSGVLDANYKVSLTVRQLAFYIYLNVECGIITEQRAKKIHQYAITHIDTQEKSGISEKSFKNAYYLHHAEDIKKVMEKLAKMLAIARERY